MPQLVPFYFNFIKQVTFVFETALVYWVRKPAPPHTWCTSSLHSTPLIGYGLVLLDTLGPGLENKLDLYATGQLDKQDYLDTSLKAVEAMLDIGNAVTTYVESRSGVPVGTDIQVMNRLLVIQRLLEIHIVNVDAVNSPSPNDFELWHSDMRSVSLQMSDCVNPMKTVLGIGTSDNVIVPTERLSNPKMLLLTAVCFAMIAIFPVGDTVVYPDIVQAFLN